MKWELFFSLVFAVFAIGLLVFYWFIPVGEINFNSGPAHSNFSVGNSSGMQFYPNMRFPSPEISYKIYECGLQKQNDMMKAFEIVSGKTSLVFNEVENGEEVSVTCSEEVKMDEGLFIAGEGGPTKIIQTDLFNVILSGKVLLIKDSECSTPNVAIHELLHVLGFDHSENPNNIMYYMSKCGQTIGDDTVELINKLYATPGYADLTFGNVSASVRGTYLDAEINVKNNGLVFSEETEIFIYADGKLVKTLDLKPLDVGAGLKFDLKNAWIKKRNPDTLEFVIGSDFEELDKGNNELVLDVLE
jgi:hypothetical protein